MNKNKLRGEFRQRKQYPPKTPLETTLVICEGKTEKAYFNHLREVWKIGPALRVEISPGSSPISIVDAACALKKENAFKTVWCVFDDDGQESFSRAKDKASKHKIQCVISSPCIEYWLLLHFEFTTRLFQNCSEVNEYLRQKHIPGYRKSDPPMGMLDDNVAFAIENANKSCGGGSRCYTQVHLLIGHIESLSTTPNRKPQC